MIFKDSRRKRFKWIPEIISCCSRCSWFGRYSRVLSQKLQNYELCSQTSLYRVTVFHQKPLRRLRDDRENNTFSFSFHFNKRKRKNFIKIRSEGKESIKTFSTFHFWVILFLLDKSRAQCGSCQHFSLVCAACRSLKRTSTR